jgi:hypothetical protein
MFYCLFKDIRGAYALKEDIRGAYALEEELRSAACCSPRDALLPF